MGGRVARGQRYLRLHASAVELLESRCLLALTANMLSDINPGAAGSHPGEFTEVFNQQTQVVFVADDGSVGRELWRSDGTSGGTTLIADIHPGSMGSSPSNLTVATFTFLQTEVLYFTADDGEHGRELWRSDGRSAMLVADIHPGATGSEIVNLATLDAFAFFGADDGNLGNELWATEGTRDEPAAEGGAQLVLDINSGAPSSNPSEMTRFRGQIWFTADDGVVGDELWVASISNTLDATLVADINPGPAGSSISEITGVIFTTYFVADDGTHGRELWKHDDQGTALVKDIVVGAGSSAPENLVNVNGTLYFTADDGINGRELWKSNGTELGTVLVRDVASGAAGSSPDNLVNVNGTLFFTADDGIGGRELWTSDGTADGTVMVADIQPGNVGSDPRELINVAGRLFFTADDGVHGREVWTSDGTTPGTVMVADIAPGSAGSDPKNLANVAGWLFFSADDGVHGAEPWTISEAPEGAGNDTIALYDPETSTFYFKNTNSPGPADGTVQYGVPNSGWLPVAGDWNGDSLDSFGLYDPETGTFFLKHDLEAGPADIVVQFGPAGIGLTPLAGDWDNDGETTIGLYDPSNGTFFLKFDNTPGPADVTVQLDLGPQPEGVPAGVAGAWHEGEGTKIGLQDRLRSTIAELDGAAFSWLQGPFVPTMPLAGDWFDRGFDAMGRYEPDTGTFFLFPSSGPGPAEAVVQFGPGGAGWLPIAGNWDGTTAGLPLLAAVDPIDAGLDVQPLGHDELRAATGAALTHFAAVGLDARRVEMLANLEYQIVDLPGGLLGLQSANNVWIDYNAAGHGWFTGLSADAAVDADRFDLLTVVLHEMGHALGLDDLPAEDSGGLMSPQIELGVRLLPTAELVDALFATLAS